MYALIVTTDGMIVHGNYPTISLEGNKYVFVLYIQDENIILVELMKKLAVTIFFLT